MKPEKPLRTTPETDEFEQTTCEGNESSLAFARQLERQRDDLRDVLSQIKSTCDTAKSNPKYDTVKIAEIVSKIASIGLL